MLLPEKALCAIMLVLTTSCSVLGYSEEAVRFNDKEPAGLTSRTITDARGDKVTLVRAAINGEDRGWFLLVSGSYFCIIDAAYVGRIEGLSKQDEGAEDRISIFDPDSFELSGGEWQPLGFYNSQPVLQGRVNRQHSAPFAIDTGASGNVSFYSVFTATHDVTEGHPTVEKTASTLCGEAADLETTVRVFEIAGKTFKNLPVTIMQPGSILDVAPGVMGGIVGRELFEDHVVVFDVKNARFALVGE